MENNDVLNAVIEHGNWNSGRYRRGSGKHPRSTGARDSKLRDIGNIIKERQKLRVETAIQKPRDHLKNVVETHQQKNQINRKAMLQGSKQARSLLKIRQANDKIIRKGLKKLSTMTPEEAAEFTEKLKRFNSVDMITEEHMRSIAETKISQVKLYNAKLDALGSGLKTIKTAMSVVQDLMKDPAMKNLSESLGKVETATKAKTKVNNPESIEKLAAKYSKFTGASKERATKEVTNILATAEHTEKIDKMFKAAVKKENKNKEDD